MPVGTPILLAPDGFCDPTIAEFFVLRSHRSTTTSWNYAHGVKTFLDFLETRGRHWSAATPDDILDFRYWRLGAEDNPRTVAASSFNTNLAAIRSLYEYAADMRRIDKSPVLTSISVNSATGESTEKSNAAAKGAKSYDVKWLTPRAFEAWRDFGIRGYLPSGLRDESTKRRNVARDTAFVNGQAGTGMRRQELASLFVQELAAISSDSSSGFGRLRICDGISKSRSREVLLAVSTKRDIQTYIEGERRRSLQRAWRADLYSGPEFLKVERLTRTTITFDRGKGAVTRRINELTSTERLWLVVPDAEGRLEPMAIWLTEAGKPVALSTWDSVFRRASERCTNLGFPDLNCTTHMLRHSFALKMLVAAMSVWTSRLSKYLSEDDLRDYRDEFGGALSLVQHLLGHRSPETTRDIYAAPLQGLQIEHFLSGGEEEFLELARRLIWESPQVIKFPTEAGPPE